MRFLRGRLIGFLLLLALAGCASQTADGLLVGVACAAFAAVLLLRK